MAISIGDALLKIGVDKKDFDRDMKGLRGSINKHRKAIGIGMVGLGVAAVGAAAASIKAFADMGDEVQKMALRTGFSTEALSEFRHVAQISGADLTTLEKGVKKMSKTIVDADEGMATYIRSFDRIGLSAEELMELAPEEQFIRITEAIAELESPTLRAATAQDIFGRAGTQLLPMMEAGADGIKELRKEAHKLGIVFDKEAAETAASLKDSLTRLQGAIKGVQFTLARELLPATEAAIKLLEEWAIDLGPIIANVLNWRLEETRLNTIRHQSIILQHQAARAAEGWSNTFEEQIDIIEQLYIEAGRLNEETKDYIARMREVAATRNAHRKAIDEENKSLEEQNELLEEQREAYEEITEMIDEAIEEMQYERSEAGRLGISIDDVIKALHLMGESNEYIADTLVELGDEQNNVLTVMDAFGLKAIEIADILGMEVDAVRTLISAYEDLEEVKEVPTGPRLGEPFPGMGEVGTIPFSELTPAQVSEGIGLGGHFWAPTEEDKAALRAYYERGLAGGGIAMSPITARIAERSPEAVIPLDRLEGMIGGKKVNIYVELDGRTIARAIGQPLVDEIRLRTGVHI